MLAAGMRLAFALYDYFPFGGLERDCRLIAERCAAAGHEVVAFARTWQGPPPAGVLVRTFGRRGLTIPARNRNYVAALQQALAAERTPFDAVIGFQKLPGLDVYYGTDPCYAAGVYQKPWWKRWLPRYRHYLANERAVFAPEHGVVVLQYIDRDIDAYSRHYGTRREQFVVLPPNAVRAPYTPADRAHARAAVRAELGAGPDDFVLLAVGSAFHRKGFDRAVDALATLPDERARLAVLGRDDPRPLQQLAARRGVGARVHCLGGRSDAATWFLGADLLVHPARRENTGTVLVEALHHGLPAVATARCGYASHISLSGSGLQLHDPFDASAFAAALRTAADPVTRAHWRAAALAYASTGAIYGCHERAADAILAAAAATSRRRRAP